MGPARKEPDQSTYVGRVAARIRKLREKTGMTVEEFAARVSKIGQTTVCVSTAYSWENGNSSPNLKMLPLLAEALNLSKVRNLLPNE